MSEQPEVTCKIFTNLLNQQHKKKARDKSRSKSKLSLFPSNFIPFLSRTILENKVISYLFVFFAVILFNVEDYWIGAILLCHIVNAI